jgi:hypothetical protein
MTPDEATRQVLTKALLATYTYAGKPDRARMIADAILATEPGSRLTTTDHPDVRAGLALADAFERELDLWHSYHYKQPERVQPPIRCWNSSCNRSAEALASARAALSATSEPTVTFREEEVHFLPPER